MSAPILRRSAPAPFFHLLFWIFQIHPPLPGGVIKTYFPPFLKPSHFLLDQCDYEKKSLLSCQFFQFIHPCRLMKNSIPQSQVIWVHVIAVIHICYVKQNKFKRITLSFVYFWQVILFWAVILHITESNTGNISQTLNKQVKLITVLSERLSCRYLLSIYIITWVFNSVFIFCWCFSYSIGVTN